MRRTTSSPSEERSSTSVIARASARRSPARTPATSASSVHSGRATGWMLRSGPALGVACERDLGAAAVLLAPSGLLHLAHQHPEPLEARRRAVSALPRPDD